MRSDVISRVVIIVMHPNPHHHLHHHSHYISLFIHIVPWWYMILHFLFCDDGLTCECKLAFRFWYLGFSGAWGFPSGLCTTCCCCSFNIHNNTTMIPISIPILDRLTFRDYQRYHVSSSLNSNRFPWLTWSPFSLIFAVLFFGFESLVRIIVTILPSFIIRSIDVFIAR